MQRETAPRKEEAYWKFYQTSMMELFYEKSYRLKIVNFSSKKVLEMFGWVLSTPLVRVVPVLPDHASVFITS